MNFNLLRLGTALRRTQVRRIREDRLATAASPNSPVLTIVVRADGPAIILDLVLVLGSSLRLASIAFLAEGEIQIVADQADPILELWLRCRLC